MAILDYLNQAPQKYSVIKDTTYSPLDQALSNRVNLINGNNAINEEQRKQEMNPLLLRSQEILNNNNQTVAEKNAYDFKVKSDFTNMFSALSDVKKLEKTNPAAADDMLKTRIADLESKGIDSSDTRNYLNATPAQREDLYNHVVAIGTKLNILQSPTNTDAQLETASKEKVRSNDIEAERNRQMSADRAEAIQNRLLMQQRDLDAKKALAEEKALAAHDAAQAKNDAAQAKNDEKVVMQHEKIKADMGKNKTFVNASSSMQKLKELEVEYQRTNPGFTFDTYNQQDGTYLNNETGERTKLDVPGVTLLGIGKIPLPGQSARIGQKEEMAVGAYRLTMAGQAVNDKEHANILRATGQTGINDETDRIAGMQDIYNDAKEKLILQLRVIPDSVVESFINENGMGNIISAEEVLARRHPNSNASSMNAGAQGPSVNSGTSNSSTSNGNGSSAGGTPYSAFRNF
jgi:hypothetical protein